MEQSMRLVVVASLLVLSPVVSAAPLPLPLRPTDIPFTRVAAASDTNAADTDFLFQLGMLEGHLLVGHELLEAHRPALALPHFGHPLTEIYDNISDYLQQHKFPPFNEQLAELEATATAMPEAPDTEAKYQAVI